MTDFAANTVTVSWGGAIDNILSFSGPEMKVEAYDTVYISGSDSPAIMTKTPVVVDNGDVKISLGWDHSKHQALFTAFAAGTTQSMVVSYGGSGSFTFDAFCTAFNFSGGSAKDQLKAELTFAITGAVS